MNAQGHEQVCFFTDRAAGYRGIIAIHDRTLGPALGGTRVLAYASESDALYDVLRLSRGMTYKGALADVAIGGGKAVIIADGSSRRDELFRAHGRAVQSLGGRYLTSVDIGSSPADMEFVRQETNYVLGLDDRSGDPSPSTARGVLRAMQAMLMFSRGSDSLKGIRVAIQGCGNVGASLARQLRQEGAELTVADIDDTRARMTASQVSGRVVDTADILAADVDIIAPCARGAVIDDEMIARIQAPMIAGGANNQLQLPRHDDALRERGILYAPDYAANAGGLIHLTEEFAAATRAAAAAKVERIYDTILEVLAVSRNTGCGTQAAADRLAEQRLAQGKLEQAAA